VFILDFIGARMTEAVVTTAIRRAKLQSNRHHQQANVNFLKATHPSCRPTNSVKVLTGMTTKTLLLQNAHHNSQNN